MTTRARKAAALAAPHDDLRAVPYELLYLAGDIREVSQRTSELLLLAASCLEADLKGGIPEPRNPHRFTLHELRAPDRTH